MSTDAADVAALLPADRRVGEIEVVEIEVAEKWDTDDWGDVLVVTLILADPVGPTWSTDDLDDLETRIQRGLRRAGEERWAFFEPRSVGDLARAEAEAEDPDPEGLRRMPQPPHRLR